MAVLLPVVQFAQFVQLETTPVVPVGSTTSGTFCWCVECRDVVHWWSTNVVHRMWLERVFVVVVVVVVLLCNQS